MGMTSQDQLADWPVLGTRQGSFPPPPRSKELYTVGVNRGNEMTFISLPAGETVTFWITSFLYRV